MNLLHPRGVCSSSSSMWHGPTSLLLLTAFCCLRLCSALLLPLPLHVTHKLISHKYSPCPKQQLPHERLLDCGRPDMPCPFFTDVSLSASPYPYPSASVPASVSSYPYLCAYAKSCATRAIPCLCFINFICFPLCFPPQAESKQKSKAKCSNPTESGESLMLIQTLHIFRISYNSPKFPV